VTKPNPENCKNCSSKCAYDCAQLQYTIQNEAVLIISPLNSGQTSQLRCCLSEERGHCEYDSLEKNIKQAAQVFNDNDMLVKIGNVAFHSKEVKYHDVCKRRYLNNMRDELKKANSPPAEEKQVNSAALKNIFMFIESSVIDNRRPVYLVSLHRHYCQYLERESDGDVAPHTVRALGEKIVQNCGDRVKLDYSSRKEDSVLYSSKANKSRPFPWLQNPAQPKNIL